MVLYDRYLDVIPNAWFDISPTTSIFHITDCVFINKPKRQLLFYDNITQFLILSTSSPIISFYIYFIYIYILSIICCILNVWITNSFFFLSLPFFFFFSLKLQRGAKCKSFGAAKSDRISIEHLWNRVETNLFKKTDIKTQNLFLKKKTNNKKNKKFKIRIDYWKNIELTEKKEQTLCGQKEKLYHNNETTMSLVHLIANKRENRW